MTEVNRPPHAAQRSPTSKFTRLAITHALMMGGDAAMVVALADSFFFSVDLDAARTQVLLFLAISIPLTRFVDLYIGDAIMALFDDGTREMRLLYSSMFRKHRALVDAETQWISRGGRNVGL